MAKPDFFIDMHCHPSLRSMNSNAHPNKQALWESSKNPEINTPIGRWARMQTSDIEKSSQSNLYAYSSNNTKVIVDAMYPVEKGWYNFRKFPKFLVGNKSFEETLQVSTGIEYSRLQALINNPSYVDELQLIYEYLFNNQGPSPDGKHEYELVSSFDDIVKLHSAKPNALAVILSIEGAHALGAGSPVTQNMSLKKQKAYLTDNIKRIKSWDHTPITINLAHHFWNELAGHSKSMKAPMHLVFNQNIGLDKGITELGWHVIEELLSRSNGKRILVDVKHMSVTSRLEYYEFIRRNNFINSDNKIPIVCGHAATNGYKTIRNSVRVPDTNHKLSGSYLNNWSINLSREEINLIHSSGGRIGIMLDKGILGSPTTFKRIDAIKDPEVQKNSYCKLICDNIFNVVEAIGTPEGWNTPMLASDFDGLISHVNRYNNATKLPLLQKDLVEYLEASDYRKDVWFGLKPSEMIYRFMTGNAYDFLKLNFI